MRNAIQRSVAAAALTLAALVPIHTPSAAAQEPFAADPGAGQVVDRVAAVVGDSVILLSEVHEQMFRLSVQGLEIPDDPMGQEQMARQVLDQMVDEQLLLQAAARDTTIAVSDERVLEAVEQEMQQQMQRAGGEAALRQALAQQGQTLSDFRASMADEIRRHFLLQQYMELQRQQAGEGAVAEDQLRAYFEEYQDQLDTRPATVTFRQVILQPRASEEAREAATERARELRQMILDGEDFEEVARRHSDDPGSRDQGGDLGWFRQGEGLVEEFEDAAFRLREGQLSDVVESPFGAHVIRVDRRRGGERRIRHILVRTEITDADLERTRERAQEVRDRLDAGESVDDLLAEFPTVGIPDSLSLPVDRLDQLPGAYAEGLQDVEAGDIVGPMEFEFQGQETLAVIQVHERREEGAYTFEDLREELQEQARVEQLQERLIERLRNETHVEVRI